MRDRSAWVCVLAALGWTWCATLHAADVDISKPCVADEHTVLLLHFDEDKGTPKDSSARKQKVILKGATLTREGKLGGGMDLSGGFLIVPHAKSLRIEDAMTVEMWIKPTAQDVGKGYHILAHKRAIQTQRLYLALSHGYLTAYPAVRGKSKLKADKWYHVAYVVTATKKYGGREYLLVNGVLDAEQPSKWDGLIDNAPLRIGGLAKNQERFQGIIDEVRISSVARPYPGVPKPEAEPVAKP